MTAHSGKYVWTSTKPPPDIHESRVLTRDSAFGVLVRVYIVLLPMLSSSN